MLDIKEYEVMMMFDLPESEREMLSLRLNSLEETFAALEKIETDGTEPLVTVLTLSNIMREDKHEKLYSREELLKNAPEQSEGYFQVPGTI